MSGAATVPEFSANTQSSLPNGLTICIAKLAIGSASSSGDFGHIFR